MRKETSKIMNAFYRGKPARAARTHTDGQTVWLHNNRIAWRNDHGDICFTLAGWATTTTRERINGLLNTFGENRWGVCQHKHDQYLTYYSWITGKRHMEPIGDNEVINFTTLRTFEREYRL